MYFYDIALIILVSGAPWMMNPSFFRSSKGSTTISAFTEGSHSESHNKSLPVLREQPAMTIAENNIAMILFIKSFYWLDSTIFIVFEFTHLEASEPGLSS